MPTNGDKRTPPKRRMSGRRITIEIECSARIIRETREDADSSGGPISASRRAVLFPRPSVQRPVIIRRAAVSRTLLGNLQRLAQVVVPRPLPPARTAKSQETRNKLSRQANMRAGPGKGGFLTPSISPGNTRRGLSLSLFARRNFTGGVIESPRRRGTRRLRFRGALGREGGGELVFEGRGGRGVEAVVCSSGRGVR